MQDDRSTTGSLPSTPNPTPSSDPLAEWHERHRRLQEQEKRQLAILTLGGIKAFEEYTFERFRRDLAPEAFDAAVRFDPKRHNLYFWGPSQVGKTHLSTAIAHRALDQGLRALVILIPDFKDTLRMFEGAYDWTEKKRYVERCVKADVLVMHEFGRGSISELIQETLWSILEKRILARRNGLVITSNFALFPTGQKEENTIGQKYGGTIAERIRALCGKTGIIRFPERHRAAANE